MRWLLLVSLLGLFVVGVSAQEAARFSLYGDMLPGPQLKYDCAFELMDFDGDGLLDIYLAKTGMHSMSVHLNEGTATMPRFGFAVGYPINLTETEPQTTEHNQILCVNDLNHDGLFDMIYFDGQLRMGYNVGTPHGPNHWRLWQEKRDAPFFPGSEQMLRENARYVTGPESMYWNKGIFPRLVLTMTVADWDGDGLEDLLICRFKDEAPGVKSIGANEQWNAWGRTAISKPTAPLPDPNEPKYLGKLKQAPTRGLYFYKNVGTREKPWFETGVEVTAPNGQSLAVPNPVVMDVDGDGKLDLLSTETQYACNAYRVDWPTLPAVQWFRRPGADPAKLETGRALLDAAGKPIPAGNQVRVADFRKAGANDLFVLDPETGIRWYRNAAKTGMAQFGNMTVLTGADFNRFDFMCQPVIVDWFGKGSRDLIVHGNIDAHCKWSLRRTALYRNVAKQPGEIKYAFAGWLKYSDDLAMVPTSLEERPYDIYGSFVSLMPDDGTGKRRLVMSVNGQLYLFTDLASDGLTFKTRIPLNIPNPGRNRMKGWQEIAVDVPEAVRYIRVGNDRNGMGNLRDSFLHIVNFEALDAAGKNWTTVGEEVQIKKLNKETVVWYQVQNPQAMFTPGNAPSGEQPNFTSFGYYIGPAVITLKQPVALKKIRFLLSDREQAWYRAYWPFYWQGNLYRQGTEQGEPWYNYTVEVSADEEKWVTVADRMPTEMMRSCPEMVDWDGDGKIDLLLGVLNSKGIWPNHVVYRLYRNQGTNDKPVYTTSEPLCDENGKPLQVNANWYIAYAPQCGVVLRDLNDDGKRDLVVEYGNRLISYLHAGETPRELKFKRGRELGDKQPIDYPAGYRYFTVDDVDGDGALDIINSASAQMVYFKGLKPGEVPGAPVDTPAGMVLRTIEACTLDAQKPDAVYPTTPSALEVRAPGQEKQKVILLRIKDIPKLAALERAALELTTDPALQKEGQPVLQNTAMLAVSCNSIRDDWDVATATYNAAKPGAPWAKDELDAGGVFLSKAPPQFTVQPRRTLRWDVTAAVRDALKQGRTSISLLVRVDYTGKYIAGQGYRFCGPAWKDETLRPRLVLITKE
ncbi:MAG: hypothetical protein BWY76_01668 [bacterium ADurb.Bin429]|nr:MAG: hypothetical protein BWY76_01668 [bacterium ADurb.Bin429]